MLRFIRLLKENPIWAAAWALFSMSVGFLINHEYTFPQEQAFFQQKSTEIEQLKAEFDTAKSVISLYRQINTDLANRAEALSKSLDREALSSQNLSATTSNLVRALEENRRRLGASLAVLRNTYFENPALKELLELFVKDIEAFDKFTEVRIEFLNRTMTDIQEARKQIPAILHNIPEQTAALEADARGPLIDKALERARHEFNDKLVAAQAQEKMYRMRSRAAILAWSYIGGFAGALIGRFLYYLRPRSRRSSGNKTD